MRKPFLYIFSLSLFCFLSCDDGDIIDFAFEFNEEFEYCPGVDDLVLYKTKTDPSESLSLLLPDFTYEELIAVEENDTLILEDEPATFYFRTYSDASLSGLFCNDIPPNVNIIEDKSDAVLLDIITVLTEADSDGIPSALEDINGNGILTDDDTDGDGIPNYIDADDDGDNILTVDENPDPNGDGDFSDAQDTDGDGIPDYLDPDDDGDGVLTRDEENDSQDQNPANDITDGTTPDYLNRVIADETPATAYRRHSYNRTFVISVEIKDISIDVISQDIYDFGFLTVGPTSTSVTPDF